MRLCLLVALFVLSVLTTTATMACGPNTNCKLDGDRHYRIRMPAGHDGKTKIGAIVYAHGYTGNASQAMRSKGFGAMARRLNVALISVKSAFLDWSLPGAPSEGKRARVDELAYFDRVLDDAAHRFPIDRNRMIATGFSAGGMMVWNLACHRSHLFAGFVPIAGTYWEPVPQRCTTPTTSIVHVHGNADKTVPLKGRRIRQAKQGEVATALKMYARHGKFGSAESQKFSGLQCRQRRNAAGDILSFCLYKGGHELYIRHIQQAWNMLVKAGKL